jgi:hypothetical protein
MQKLHPDIQAICVRNQDVALTANERETLDQYFNLCAEEYLFWHEGRILRRVWQSWCLGMLSYLNRPLIGEFWQDQQGGDSYYGLTTPLIRDGAEVAVEPRLN